MTIMSQDLADSHMQLRQYLCRIQFLSQDNWQQAELPAPTLETLITIHRLHVDNIPFENLLFVHHLLKGTHRPVDLPSLHKRIVLRKRGGMCQEQNALLLHNLRALGYTAYAGLGAMVHGAVQPASQPFQGLPSSGNLGSTQDCFGSHQIIFVTVDGLTYLCDVGAGDKCLQEPVLLRAYDDVDSTGPSQQQPPAEWLATQGESQQAGMRYRIRRGVMGSAEPLSAAAAATHPERESFVGYYLQHCIKGVWGDMYWFSRVPVTPSVLKACSDHSFNSHPLFTQHMVVARTLPGGRLSLYDFVYKRRMDGQPTQERQLQSEEERDAVLQQDFGLDLSLPALPAGC